MSSSHRNDKKRVSEELSEVRFLVNLLKIVSSSHVCALFRCEPPRLNGRLRDMVHRVVSLM